MSWSERVEVHLRPGSVSIRRARLWSSGGEAKVVPLPARAMETSEPWRASVQALAREFDATREHGSALHVVLSDHFVRFAVVPWSADLINEAERSAFARLSFAQLYGQANEGWDIALDESLVAQPSIAAAIDRALLAALRELCSARRMRMASTLPAFVRDLNRHRASMRAEAFWLVRVEPGRLTLALRRGGQWIAVRTRRLDGAGAESLSGALRQEALACGAPPYGAVYLIDSGGSVQSIPGWQTTRLGTSSATGGVQQARAAAAK